MPMLHVAFVETPDRNDRAFASLSEPALWDALYREEIEKHLDNAETLLFTTQTTLDRVRALRAQGNAEAAVALFVQETGLTLGHTIRASIIRTDQAPAEGTTLRAAVVETVENEPVWHGFMAADEASLGQALWHDFVAPRLSGRFGEDVALHHARAGQYATALSLWEEMVDGRGGVRHHTVYMDAHVV